MEEAYWKNVDFHNFTARVGKPQGRLVSLKMCFIDAAKDRLGSHYARTKVQDVLKKERIGAENSAKAQKHLCQNPM